MLALVVGCGDDDGAGPTADSGPARDAGTTGRDSGIGPGGDGGGGDVDGGTVTDAGPDIPVDLPGFIDGVEPEAHSNHPPMIDGNGNLYRVTESVAADGNNPRMMRSTDSGATWSEVDADSRPSPSDLEGCWQLQVGSTIYLSVASSDEVWLTAFNTSDAADRPDQWVLDETVEPDLANDGGVVQFSSLAATSDGQIWIFYSGTMIDGRQQIGFRRRSASGEWSDARSIGDTSGSWTGPKAIVGAGEVTHVFYKDFVDHQILWRTLSPDGTLSDATRIDTSGTSEERISHTNAMYYDDAGREVIVVGFTDPDGNLRAVTITDGVVGSEELVSVDPVLEDPAVARNDAPVAHLALHGTTVHALFSDDATGDVLHTSRPHGGAWTAPETAWASGDSIAWWVYGNVYVRAGRHRLGFTYDIGEHEDDVGNIEYDEITLTP